MEQYVNSQDGHSLIIIIFMSLHAPTHLTAHMHVCVVPLVLLFMIFHNDFTRSVFYLFYQHVKQLNIRNCKIIMHKMSMLNCNKKEWNDVPVYILLLYFIRKFTVQNHSKCRNVDQICTAFVPPFELFEQRYHKAKDKNICWT